MTETRLPAGYNSAVENDVIQKGPGGLWYSRGPAEFIPPRVFMSLTTTGGITSRLAPDVTILVDTSDAAWTEDDIVSLTPFADALVGDMVTVKDVGGQAYTKGIRIQATNSSLDSYVSYEFNLRDSFGSVTFVNVAYLTWKVVGLGSRVNPRGLLEYQASTTLRVQPVEAGTVSFGGASTIGVCSDGNGGILVATGADVATVYGPPVLDPKAALVGITECNQLVRGSASNDVIIAIGASSTNVSRSTTEGDSWSSISTTLSGPPSACVWDGTRFIICQGSNVEHSTTGATFTAGNTAGAPGSYQGLAAFSTGVVVAQISEQGFAISTNHGSTWAPAGSIAGYDGAHSGMLAGDRGREVFFLLENDDTTDLWVSTNGTAWTLRYEFPFASVFQPHLFICQDTGVLLALILDSPMVVGLSHDRGVSWTTTRYLKEGGLPGEKAGIAHGRVVWLYDEKLYVSV